MGTCWRSVACSMVWSDGRRSLHSTHPPTCLPHVPRRASALLSSAPGDAVSKRPNRCTTSQSSQTLPPLTALRSPTIASYAEHLFFARRPLPPELPSVARTAVSIARAMPRPNPPPTPGSSSEFRGKEGAHAAPAFALPPSGFHDRDGQSTSSSGSPPSNNGSDSSYRPISPAGPADAARKRPANPSGPVITKDDFALPPPPTRSRKIIQMNPRDMDAPEHTPRAAAGTSPNIAGKAGAAAPQTTAGGKRKQNANGATAAGRKIARKTAHSLIERRRRSKMNEEFGVLKDMIPACNGQEMHKLAILQVGVV